MIAYSYVFPQQIIGEWFQNLIQFILKENVTWLTKNSYAKLDKSHNKSLSVYDHPLSRKSWQLTSRYIGLVSTTLTSQKGRAIKSCNASPVTWQNIRQPVRYARYKDAVVQPCLGSRFSGHAGNHRRIRLVSSGGDLRHSGSKTFSFK